MTHHHLVTRMEEMNGILKTVSAATALLVMGTPSFANVKSGVDSWERGDFANAVKEWRPLAIKGDADAQFNLAQAYRFGRGVPLDMRQAEDWYRKAATQGHTQAEDNLGLIMFQNGNTQAAMPIIERSANRGDPRAQYVYGTALFNGELVQQNWPRAYAYMTRASAAGLSSASAAMAQMDQHIPLEQRQQGLSIARQLESQASRAKFATATPAQGPGPVSGNRYPSAAPMESQRPQIASNNIPQPSWNGQQSVGSSGGDYTPALSAPAPSMPEQVMPRGGPNTQSRGQSLPSSRGALPRPRATNRPQPRPDSGSNTDVMTQTGGVQGSDTGYPPVPYPQSPSQGQTYPSTGGYPSDTYPQASYPQGAYPQPQPSYPQATYPQQSYPQAQSYPSTTYPPAYPPARVAAPVRVAPRPAPIRRPAAPAPQIVRKTVAPVPSATTAGAWRIQLGAFSTPGAADTLWKSLRGQVPTLSGKQPYLVKSGAITRLQAGSYASRGAADSACNAVRSSGSSCMVVGR
jgi:uncharacterized protein